MDLGILLNHAPRMAKLAAALQRAANGDPRAIEYLRSEGWTDALDLWRPGAGQVTRRVIDEVRQFLENSQANVVDAEYRVVEDQPPWGGFVGRLRRQTWGGHVILGPPGSGKTSLAVKLAWVWHQTHGYQVDAVNLYESDRPSFATTISTSTLVHRVTKLRRYLEAEAVPDDDEQVESEESSGAELPPGRRVILIDEASLAIGRSGMDPGRLAAFAALTQGRHVQWLTLYLAQWARLLPLDLFGQATVWVKQPIGREIETDRDNPMIRALWERAAAALAEVRRSEWYAPPYDDPRAWAYVDSPALNYAGVVPFTPVEEVGHG